MNVAVTLSPRDYDMVLFDVDGVTQDRKHACERSGKSSSTVFSTKAGKSFVAFDIETDYPRYVDDKPRYDGVADFLKSRGIELPLGSPAAAIET